MKLFSVFFAAVAAFVGIQSGQAATFTPAGSVQAGNIVTVDGDLGIGSPDLPGFDLLMVLPAELVFLGAFDSIDSSDTSPSLYTALWGADNAGVLQPAAVASPPTVGGISSGTGVNGTVFGFRVTNQAFGTLSIDQFTMGFEVAPGTGPGLIEVRYGLWTPQVSGSTTLADYSEGSFSINVVDPNVVPLPAGAVLMFTAAGALVLARRRRPAA